MDSTKTPQFASNFARRAPSPLHLRLPFRHCNPCFREGRKGKPPREGGREGGREEQGLASRGRRRSSSDEQQGRWSSMERRRSRHALLLFSAVMASLVSGSTAGIYHIVGAGKGWRMPPNRTYYADWASARQISVGDKLMFLYRSGAHNIVEVPTRELFDVCSMHNITNRYQNGPTIIELTEPGQRFYFCGVGEHCEVGQKLAINVLLVPPPPPDTDDDDDEDNDDNGDSSGASARLLAHAGAGLAAACMCLASALLVAM
ncbi:hypothetical protein BDA96_09G251700 [Sorghum bicolor]|uniref:Phytocyanin domain-containing protein n=1 Tax=Sorghum bicolor TaxID=4558 RepID=A0A921QF17_SORBI|nr:hypothetical protein BDA96_09G251700 [Sorghum bicolor]